MDVVEEFWLQWEFCSMWLYKIMKSSIENCYIPLYMSDFIMC